MICQFKYLTVEGESWPIHKRKYYAVIKNQYDVENILM